MKIKDIFDKEIGKKLSKIDGELEGLYGQISFNISGKDGGQWTINFDDAPPKINVGLIDDPTLTVAIDCEDFKAVLNSTLNPVSAYFSGKLKVAGDMGLAFKLASFLREYLHV